MTAFVGCGPHPPCVRCTPPGAVLCTTADERNSSQHCSSLDLYACVCLNVAMAASSVLEEDGLAYAVFPAPSAGSALFGSALFGHQLFSVTHIHGDALHWGRPWAALLTTRRAFVARRGRQEVRRSPSPGPSSRSSHLAPVVPPAHLGRRPVLPPAGGARHVRRPSDKQLSRVARCAPLPEAGPACPGAQAGGRQQRRKGCGRRHPGGCLGHHTFASGLPRALRLLVSGQRQASGRRPAAPRAASGVGAMCCAPTTREDMWSASRRR